MKAHRGTLILILGILGLVCCGIFTAIPAWVMGSSDLKEMEAGNMDPAGKGATNAGKICGMIGCIITIVGGVAWVGLMFIGMLGAM